MVVAFILAFIDVRIIQPTFLMWSKQASEQDQFIDSVLANKSTPLITETGAYTDCDVAVFSDCTVFSETLKDLWCWNRVDADHLHINPYFFQGSEKKNISNIN